LDIKHDKEFIDYVNKVTARTIKYKQQGKKFISLNELQAEYEKI
jgi:hypothetical protein